MSFEGGCRYYIKSSHSYCGKPIYKYYYNYNKNCKDHYYIDDRYKKCSVCKKNKVYFNLEEYNLCEFCFKHEYGENVRDYIKRGHSKSDKRTSRCRSQSPKREHQSPKHERTRERERSKSPLKHNSQTVSVPLVTKPLVPRYISVSDVSNTKDLDIKQTIVLDDDQFYQFKTAAEDEMININLPVSTVQRDYIRNMYNNLCKRLDETKVALHNTTVMSHQIPNKWTSPQKLNERLHGLYYRCSQLYYIVKIICDSNYTPLQVQTE